jgi:thiosulfate dehydrogenase [quinone] large subunit
MTTEISSAAPARAADTAPRAERDEPLGARWWGVLRIGLGWIFLWAFLDKLLALGFATGRDPETGQVDRFGDAAWINGGSPTEGFLTNGLSTRWFFDDLYSSLAGLWWVDWIYMLSMLGIGVALMLGIAVRPAAIAGVIWMILFYTAAALWPENNPFFDDHLVYAIVLAALAAVSAGRYLGLGRRWERLGFVRRNPLLR